MAKRTIVSFVHLFFMFYCSHVRLNIHKSLSPPGILGAVSTMVMYNVDKAVVENTGESRNGFGYPHNERQRKSIKSTIPYVFDRFRVLVVRKLALEYA